MKGLFFFRISFAIAPIFFLGLAKVNAGAVGNEFLCNQTTAGNQATFGRNSVAMDGSGNFIVVWASTQSTTSDIYARRFDKDGNPLAGEFIVNSYTQDGQTNPAVAMNASGQFIIAWEFQDIYGLGIAARGFNANGTPAMANDIMVNTSTDYDQQFPAVGIDSSGNCVCVWQSDFFDGQNFDSDIYFQRFSLTGADIGGETWVNNLAYLGDQVVPAVAMGAGGNFVIAWSGPVAGESGDEVICKAYNNSGQALFAEEIVNTYGAGEQILPSVALDSGGNITVVWMSFQDNAGADYGIYAQRVGSLGAYIGSEIHVNTTLAGAQQNPYIAMDSNGYFTVVWEGPDASGFGIFGQSYDPVGAVFGGEFAINSTTANDQTIPSCIVDGAGRGVCVWTSLSQDAASTWGVYGCRFTQLTQGAHWKLNEGSGTSAFDSTGNGNTGTLQTGATWTAGKNLGGLALNGSGSVSLPASNSLNITSDITLMAWIKTSSTTLGQHVISGYNFSPSYQGYGFLVNYPSMGKIGYWSGAHGNWVGSTSSNYNDGNWHHVAVALSGSTASFYKDGVADGTVASARPNSWTGTRSLGINFSGTLDDVRIFNRALSSAEILAIIQAIPSRKNSDFNNDGKADILFRHPSNGDVVLWLMN